MAKTNTEKPTGKEEKSKMQEVKTQKKVEAPKAKAPAKEKTPVKENKVEKKESTSKAQVKPKVQKEEVKVVGRSLTMSTKVAASICKFLKGKRISEAIKDLEEVSKLKKAVPMKGEYAHRKGRIMSGKFPVRAATEMIFIVKSLQNNANQADLEDAIISTAIANKAIRPFAKGGRARKKRSHVTLIAKDKKTIKQKKKKK